MANRVSNDQLEELLEFLAQRPALAKGVGLGARSKETVDKHWNDLASKLNSYGSGSTKSAERWKKYWSDIKHKSKARLAKRKRDALGTGGGPSSQEDISEIDKKILAIIGEQVVFGDREHQIPVFNTDPNPEQVPKKNLITVPELVKKSDNVANDDNSIHKTVESSPSKRGQTCKVYSSEFPITGTTSTVDTETLPQYVSEEPQRGTQSPVSRLHVDRPRLRRSRISISNTTTQSRIDQQWVMDLERRRVEAETNLANAALIMAEASCLQAETSHLQANTLRALVAIIEKRENIRTADKEN